MRSAYSLARVLSPSVIGTAHRTPLNYWQGGVYPWSLKYAMCFIVYISVLHTGATGPVYCLESGGSMLFSGGSGGVVKSWKWSNITDKVSFCAL